ncbi:MAG: HypC/HybG/HupF family hydrogenase formation chaperone [Maricaulaceae bacterium]
MCLGVPMEVIAADGLTAICRGAGRTDRVSLALLGPVAEGTHVLVYLGSAVQTLAAEEAARITDALRAVDAAARGAPFDHLIQDLIDRKPELPAHLRGETPPLAEETHERSDPGGLNPS